MIDGGQPAEHPQPQDQPSIDEMFAQIAKNQRALSDAIQSQEARLCRLDFRINRLESEKNG